MKSDNTKAMQWRVTLGSIYRDNIGQLQGRLFGGLIDKNGALLDLTVFSLIAAQHVMLDPVSVLLMCLYQKVGKAQIADYTFALCVPAPFPISSRDPSRRSFRSSNSALQP